MVKCRMYHDFKWNEMVLSDIQHTITLYDDSAWNEMVKCQMYHVCKSNTKWYTVRSFPLSTLELVSSSEQVPSKVDQSTSPVPWLLYCQSSSLV